MTKNKVGRPSLGETKKVSVTLEKDFWQQMEDYCQEKKISKSEFLRELIQKTLVEGEHK